MVRTEDLLAPLSCRPLGLDADGRLRFLLEGVVPAELPVVDGVSPLSATRTLQALGSDGSTYTVRTALDGTDPVVTPGSTLLASSTIGGALSLLDAPSRVLVDTCVVQAHPPELTVVVLEKGS